jgi:hypothetical protein
MKLSPMTPRLVTLVFDDGPFVGGSVNACAVSYIGIQKVPVCGL